MKLPYIFERYSETWMVIEVLIPEVKKAIEKYGCVAVADVYGIMDKICCVFEETPYQFIDVRRGWTDINDFLASPYVERHWGYTEYGIKVSEPKYL